VSLNLIVRWHVRNVLLLVFCLTCSATAHISQPSPIQTPQQISLRFSPDAHVEFALSNGRVVGVTARVGRMTPPSFPLENCVELSNVRFDTLQLIRDDLRSQDPHDTFSLLFDFGSEIERQHGRLPRVQLSYGGGKWAIAVVTRATGDKSSFSSSLCAAPNAT
jgi:hypothetical protein